MAQALENQKKVAKRFIELEATWDADAIASLHSDDCKHQLLPYSLGHPERNNEEFKDFYRQFSPIWEGYKIQVFKEIHDAENHTCAIHMMNTSDSTIGPFKVESLFMLTFTEDGEKIRRVEEIVDSKDLLEFLGRLPAPDA